MSFIGEVIYLNFDKMVSEMEKYPDGDLYKECLFDMIDGCADYVSAVTKMESYRSIPSKNGAEFREKLTQLDKTRTIFHNSLISKITVLNRICAKIGLEPVCADRLPRAEYGDFAFTVVKDFFEHRVR